jgi:hypothetical protein
MSNGIHSSVDRYMLQDSLTIRYYQRLSDALVELWNRGYRYDDMRLYLDGYLAALRQSSVLEPYQINRLEEEITRYIYDPSNFESVMPEPDYR